jgi:hypothetical protein
MNRPLSASGDHRRPRHSAPRRRRVLTAGKAETAIVEAASLAIGASSLTGCYRTTGTGWTARRTGAGVRRAAFTVRERAGS